MITAALLPINDAERLLECVNGLRQKYTSSLRICVVQCNGMPALALLHGDTLERAAQLRSWRRTRGAPDAATQYHTLEGLPQAPQQILQQPAFC